MYAAIESYIAYRLVIKQRVQLKQLTYYLHTHTGVFAGPK